MFFPTVKYIIAGGPVTYYLYFSVILWYPRLKMIVCIIYCIFDQAFYQAFHPSNIDSVSRDCNIFLGGHNSINDCTEGQFYVA